MRQALSAILIILLLFIITSCNKKIQTESSSQIASATQTSQTGQITESKNDSTTNQIPSSTPPHSSIAQKTSQSSKTTSTSGESSMPNNSEKTKTIGASIDNVRYLGGAIAPVLSWSASGFEFKISCRETTKVKVNLSVANVPVAQKPGDNFSPRIGVFIDSKNDAPANAFIVKNYFAESYQIASLSKGEHIIRICKLNEYGNITVSSIEITESAVIKPTSNFNRKIDFVGDSITSGFKADRTAALEKSYYDTNESSGIVSFASVTARALNANYALYAIAGSKINIIDRYLNQNLTCDGKLADVIVVNLGTNDAWSPDWNTQKNTFTADYETKIRSIMAKNSKATIFCTGGLMDTKALPYIKAAVDNIHSSRVYYLEFPNIATASHPNIEQQNTAAQILTSKIKEVMGW